MRDNLDNRFHNNSYSGEYEKQLYAQYLQKKQLEEMARGQGRGGRQDASRGQQRQRMPYREQMMDEEMARRKRLRAAKLRRMQELKRKRQLAMIAIIGIPAVIILLVFGIRVLNAQIQKTRAEKLEQAAIAAAQEAERAAQEEAEAAAAAEEAAAQAAREEAEAALTRRSPEVKSFAEGYTVTSNSPAYLGLDADGQSTYGVLIDVDKGEVIAQKNASERMSPASMTKILTCLVAIEHLQRHAVDEGISVDELLQDTTEITQEFTNYAYSNDGMIVGFSIGEAVTVEDLLYGTILPSGADAASALADYIVRMEGLETEDHRAKREAGEVADPEDTQAAFAALMNEKLAQLGLSSTTHFTNCVGLYGEDHYSTMIDMAMILKAAVENDLCRKVLSEHSYTTTKTEEHPDGIEISNWFLRRIEDKDCHGEVLCAKTGFVNESGCCAASYQISNSGGHYICVTANAWSVWRCIYDHVEVYDNFTN